MPAPDAVFAGTRLSFRTAGSALAILATGVATFVQFEQIGRALLVAGVIGVAATVIGMALSAWMPGRGISMNAVVVFVSLLFFGWLWGGWCLLVGVSLLAIVKTTAKSIPSIERLAALLADEPRPVREAAART